MKRIKKPCAKVGCNTLIAKGKTYCDIHEAEHKQRYDALRKKRDKERGSASKRGYDFRWQKARKTYLAHHPLCVICEKKGITTLATVVDHIIPHRGNSKLFWDVENWQPLCEICHNKKTASGR